MIKSPKQTISEVLNYFHSAGFENLELHHLIKAIEAINTLKKWIGFPVHNRGVKNEDGRLICSCTSDYNCLVFTCMDMSRKLPNATCLKYVDETASSYTEQPRVQFEPYTPVAQQEQPAEQEQPEQAEQAEQQKHSDEKNQPAQRDQNIWDDNLEEFFYTTAKDNISPNDHVPYLEHKRIYDNIPQDWRTYRKSLYIPCYRFYLLSEGEEKVFVDGYEAIKPPRKEGEKFAKVKSKGLRTIEGNPYFYMFVPHPEKEKECFFLTEGAINGYYIHNDRDLRGHGVFVSFGADNLPAVAKMVEKRFPSHEVIIIGDNDPAGEKAGRKAREATGYKVIMCPKETPDFYDFVTSSTPTENNDNTRYGIKWIHSPYAF